MIEYVVKTKKRLGRDHTIRARFNDLYKPGDKHQFMRIYGLLAAEFDLSTTQIRRVIKGYYHPNKKRGTCE